MATIPHVTPDTVIESAAQNTFIDEVNNVCAKRTGSTITGTDIYSNSAPAIRLRRSGDNPLFYFEKTDGTRIGYIQCSPTALGLFVDGAAADINLNIGGTQVAQLRANGDLQIDGKFLPDGGISTDSIAAQSAALAGILTIHPVSGDECIELRSNLPYIEFRNDANTVRYGLIQGQAPGLVINSDNAVILASDSAEKMRIAGQLVLIGKTTSGLTAEGVEIHASSTAEGSIRTTTNVAAIQNLYCVHQGAADANDQNFIQFARAPGLTEIGSINQNGTSGVRYNTTSDYRLKNDLGPITDAVERLGLLAPHRFTWKTDPAAGEQDGFFAHEVTPAVPEAVTGAKDAVAPAPPLDEDGNPDPAAPAEGEIVPQQLDTSRLVPLLVAAVNELAVRLAALEAA